MIGGSGGRLVFSGLQVGWDGCGDWVEVKSRYHSKGLEYYYYFAPSSLRRWMMNLTHFDPLCFDVICYMMNMLER